MLSFQTVTFINPPDDVHKNELSTVSLLWSRPCFYTLNLVFIAFAVDFLWLCFFVLFYEALRNNSNNKDRKLEVQTEVSNKIYCSYMGQNHNHIASVGFKIYTVNSILCPQTLDSKEEKLLML